jgi:hypothetical protein
MPRVRFPFGDATLVGDVIERQPAPRFPDTDRAYLVVETDHGRYRPLERDVEVITDESP